MIMFFFNFKMYQHLSQLTIQLQMQTHKLIQIKSHQLQRQLRHHNRPQNQVIILILYFINSITH